MSESDWEREKAFWAACKVQTYDLEYSGGYGGGWEMQKQTHDPSGTNHGDYVRADDFRAEVETLRKRVEELARASLERCMVCDDARETAEARSEQLERELQSAAQEANDLNRTVERLTQELAAERERVKELQQRVSDLKFALGDGAGWFDRYRAERTAHKATTDRLTKFADSQSAELQRFREQAQRENATLAADNERLCKELLEADNARRDGRQLLRRFVKYAREDKAVTPGCTRLERLTEQVADYLRRTNNPSDILRGDEP